MKHIVFFICSFLLLLLRPSLVSAQGVAPDIRNYSVHVITRKMPTQYCPVCGTPEECIRKLIGYNELTNSQMKFSDRLFPVSDQFVRASERLTPYIAKTNMNKNKSKTTDESGNKPSWTGAICCYDGWCGGGKRLVGSDLIEAEKPITTMFKGIRFGSNLLSAYIARDHLPLTSGIYNTQRPPIQPDPQKMEQCGPEPEGVVQTDLEDKGLGKNKFWSVGQLVLDIACLTTICACENTAMYIKTDSMVQYNTDALCRTTGCTQEQVAEVDPQSQALPQAQDSGGFINAQVRPGLMAQIQEMVIQLFKSITGKVNDQKTDNNIGTRTNPSSYYTTNALEVGADFLNCKLFPYAKRSEMPECNTNWLANLIGNITNQLRDQNIVEPNEATSSSTP